MKQFPQGIFKTLDWLVKQVDRLKYQVANPAPSGLTTVEVDGITVQGSGTPASPLTAYTTVQGIIYGGSAIDLSASTANFFLITNDTGLAGADITLPSPVNGRRIGLLNQTGFSFDITAPIPVDVDGTPTSVLGTEQYMEIIGLTNAITSTTYWQIISFRTV